MDSYKMSVPKVTKKGLEQQLFHIIERELNNHVIYTNSKQLPFGLGTRWGLHMYPYGMSDSEPCEPLK